MKKQTSRFLAAFLTLLMLFSPLSIAVSALSVGETVKVSGASEWISGFYYNFSKSGFGTNKHGQHQHLHANDGRPAYCVEPNEHFTNGNKTIQKTFASLSQDTQKRITAALLYGFDGNTKYGYSWQTEYVATQGIIWTLVQGYFNTAQEDAFLNCAFGGNTSASNRAACKAVYGNIKDQILSHYTVPSFSASNPTWVSKITLKYNSASGRYEGSVTDSNGVLSGYSFSCSGVSFTKSGNTLYISTDRILDNATVSGERTSNSYVSSLPAICAGYAVGADQTTAVALDLKDPVNAYFRLETESVGHVKLVKTSEDGKVENVSLHISGNGIEKDVKTGKDGTITVKNLIAGTYTVSEITNGYYVPQTAQTFTILPGQTTTVTFNNVLKRGSLTVTKTSEDGVLEGHRFHLFGTSESGLEVNAYAVTDNTGKAYFNDILIGNGYTLEEVDTGIQYVVPNSQTTDIAWNSVTNASFENVLKKFTVTVKKQDSITGKAQGDGTLAGAVYGVYKNNTLVDTYTTDESGSFTTKEYICGDNWTLRELTSSEGYLVNETVYHIGAEAGNFTVEHNAVSMGVTEDVILGQIAIIKHNDNGDTQIETPEVGAEFEIYLKSKGSYAAANDRERDLLVIDENGFAQTKKLPYGIYTAHQTKGKDGTEFIEDFDIVINKHGEIYRYLINNATYKSYIQFTKTDAETGKTVPLAGTGIQLYDPQGNLITMTYTYPTPTTIDTFYTDNNGRLVTPEQLPYGKGYSAVEVYAPYGYVVDKTPVHFDITPETMTKDGALTVVNITKSNMPQKGTIDITKLGEVFSSVSYDGTFYQPVFSLANNKGAVFTITAAEDIITPDGTIRAKQGDVVDIVTIGNSTSQSKLLYLGKYLVQETKAAYGMVIDPTVYEVSLTYAGQDISVTSTAITVTNARQKAVIDLKKVLEQDDLFELGNNNELQKVQFALYAAEDLTATDGSVIPKDGLLEILSLNADGTAEFTTDLPVEAKAYVKEYSTDEHYILSDTEYPVIFEYAGQNVSEVRISVNNGNVIENTLKRGSIIGKKSDEQGNALADAVFGLFRAEETEYTEATALLTAVSNNDGVFRFDNVPVGEYVVIELSAPEGYLLDNTPIPVTLNKDGQIVTIKAVNIWANGKLIITKSDFSDGTLLPNVGFRIRNEQGEIVSEGYTNENGVVEFDGLKRGKYTYQEFEAKSGYILDETEYPFEITKEQAVVEVNITNNKVPIPVEIPKTGNKSKTLYFAAGTLGVLTSAAWITLSFIKRRKTKSTL